MKLGNRLLTIGNEKDFIYLLEAPIDYTEARKQIADSIQTVNDFLKGGANE